MPIRPFLAEPSAFLAEHVAAMSEAFDAICFELRLRPEQTREREHIAERIIDLGRTGVLDAAALRERVWREL
jgi:hypothetical protein